MYVQNSVSMQENKKQNVSRLVYVVPGTYTYVHRSSIVRKGTVLTTAVLLLQQ